MVMNLPFTAKKAVFWLFDFLAAPLYTIYRAEEADSGVSLKQNLA
jgi:hypothetical protein